MMIINLFKYYADWRSDQSISRLRTSIAAWNGEGN